ncbi:MAG TPA: tetratricopeptide repeat protein [Phenylobacterium sp.]|nr:tetratricopeptide repeat protein [Phenylobacterium sp.]
MPRQAQPTATSARALQTGALQSAAPAPQAFTSDAVGEAGSAAALAKLNSAVAELKAMAIAPMLQRAIDAIRAEDAKSAYDWAVKALDHDEKSGLGWYLLGIALERAGDFANSVRAYEAALKLLPDHGEVACDLGRLALRLGMKPQAEDLFRRFLERYPDDPEAANNLVCAIRDQGRHDEAIETLRPAILKMPDNPMLWNTMGTILSDQGDFTNAQVFFAEALRLDPKHPKARHNLANVLLMQGDIEGALVENAAATKGVKAEDDRQMMRLARSTMLHCVGRIGEGWDEYESRIHPQFNGRTAFAIDRPRWEPGADLAGKSFLVVCEQGLGDEVLFANVLPDLIERLGPEGKLTIAVESRLVPLFQRSFPLATVGAHATYDVGGVLTRVVPFIGDGSTINLWSPVASLMREFRRSVDTFPSRPSFLVADPKRVAHWRSVLKTAPAGLKVGLLWKSAITRDARHRYFAAFADWAPVFAQKGVTFVNLQYGDCAEELAAAKQDFGIEIWSPPGIDLRQDLDDIAALSCALDLVVGFANATFNIAAACGTPNFLVSVPGAWTRLGTETMPWYPSTRVFLPPGFGQWDAVMAEVADAVGTFVAER